MSSSFLKESHKRFPEFGYIQELKWTKVATPCRVCIQK